jgi:hypothetical protein
MAAEPRGVTEEANRLYWHTEMPVAEISSTLDLSRRALYDAIEPLPADSVCGICGSLQSFPNRSARSSGSARCMTCSGEAAAAERADAAKTDPNAAALRGSEAVAGGSQPPASPWGRLPLGVPAPAPRRGLLLTSAALLGAAVGAAATFALVRRR